MFPTAPPQRLPARPARAAGPWRWLALLLLLLAGTASAQPPADRQVNLPPSAFATLAAQLRDAEDAPRRDFAALTLDALLEAYDRELQRAAQDRPRDAEGRAKLARWQHATRGLVADLESLLRQVDAGVPLAVIVERQREVLLDVDGRLVAASGPRAEAETGFGDQVVERFCMLHDCSGYTLTPPDTAPTEATSATAEPKPPASEGVWAFNQGLRPSYQIGNRFRFDFRELGDRAAKAALCDQLADELKRLAAALQQARSQGVAVEWSRLAAAPPAPGLDQRVVLNGTGNYLRLPLPLLTRLDGGQWRLVAEWLERETRDGEALLRIEQADRLLDAPPAG